jgi:hypothetical protein
MKKPRIQNKHDPKNAGLVPFSICFSAKEGFSFHGGKDW